MTYLLFKNLHISLAAITFAGFVLRGYWMITEAEKLRHPLTRVAPHLVDTVFLVTGIVMLLLLSLNPLLHGWLLAKLAGLLGYVLLGTVALRRGSTRSVRIMAFVASLTVFFYIVGVARSKSAASWLAPLT
ncbi:MAG: SirB2 family protein [Woeseiaceae bacterium]|nr:SirB2 family protein [Woeseiaceae bacterium]